MESARARSRIKRASINRNRSAARRNSSRTVSVLLVSFVRSFVRHVRLSLSILFIISVFGLVQQRRHALALCFMLHTVLRVLAVQNTPPPLKRPTHVWRSCGAHFVVVRFGSVGSVISRPCYKFDIPDSSARRNVNRIDIFPTETFLNKSNGSVSRNDAKLYISSHPKYVSVNYCSNQNPPSESSTSTASP